jgi:intracellular sulfur oxidation DsrE/DsrF family protein
MKTLNRIAVTVLFASCVTTAFAAGGEPAGFWTTPTIQGYGPIHYLPNASFKPDAHHSYRIVFALTQAAKAPGDVNPALDHVARTVNLYTAAGVPLSHLNFVAVAYGAATPLALDDAHYRVAYGTANPNLPIIEALKKAGVTVSVCGQAVAEHHFEYGWIANDVTLALSGLTTVTTLESQGYVLMPL